MQSIISLPPAVSAKIGRMAVPISPNRALAASGSTTTGRCVR